MESETRKTQNHLIDYLNEHVHEFQLFQALRFLECANPDLPQISTSRKAQDDPFRVSQNLDRKFLSTEINSVNIIGNDRSLVHLEVNGFGLFGTNGPMPLDFTAYITELTEERNEPALAEFINLFHHRMLSLFYQAWATTNPAVAYGRENRSNKQNEASFSDYIASFLGLGLPVYKERDAFSDHAKLYYAGLLAAQNKSPEILVNIVRDVLAVPVDVEEFVPRRLHLQTEDITRLAQANSRLSISAVLGETVLECQSHFRLILGPLTLKQYRRFLPFSELCQALIIGSEQAVTDQNIDTAFLQNALPLLKAIVKNFCGDEYSWDIVLKLDEPEIPESLMLTHALSDSVSSLAGFAQLGLSTWLGRSKTHKLVFMPRK